VAIVEESAPNLFDYNGAGSSGRRVC